MDEMTSPRKKPDVESLRHEALMASNAERNKMFDSMRASGNVEIEPSPVSFEEFPENEDYAAFEKLPIYALKSLRRLSLASKLYLSGFLMKDSKTSDERDVWEREMQKSYGDDFNRIYGWSKLRRNAMTKLVSPLSLVADCTNFTHEDIPQYRALIDLDDIKVPKNLIAPYQKEVYDPERGEMKLESVTPYHKLSQARKIGIVHQIEDIALAYLELVTPEADKPALAGIHDKIVAARHGAEPSDTSIQ